MTEYRELRMSHILDDPELKKLFKKKGWVRVCSVCGEFLGNTANWILHMKTHMEMEPAVPDPAVNPEYTEIEPALPDWLYKKIRKTEDRKIEMEPASVPDPAVNPYYTEMEEVAVLPDWLYSKIRNRKTVDRFRNWWMEVKPDKESVLEDRNRNSSMEVEADIEPVLSEQEYGFTLLPEYRSWSTSSYVRRALCPALYDTMPYHAASRKK